MKPSLTVGLLPRPRRAIVVDAICKFVDTEGLEAIVTEHLVKLIRINDDR